MKKSVLALSALAAIAMMSCIGGTENGEQTEAPVDTVEQAIDSTMQVTGVAIDGAMNSVYLKVGEDTIEFTYPDLDADHRDSWDINDTLTVQYYVTESGDSVTNVINENA
jgi:hypothetical protein